MTGLLTYQTPDDSSLKLDYSSKDTAHQCLRKYLLSHILDLKPDQGSSALRYGSVWHRTMEAFYANIKDHGWTHDGGAITDAILQANTSWEEETRQHFTWYNDYRTLQNLLQAFQCYINEFVADENHLKVIAVEQPFKLPMIPSPAEQHRFPYLKPFWFTGVIDMEIYYDGRYWQLDHKTTGQPMSTQLSRLQRSAQSIGYTYAGSQVLEEIPEGHFITLHHLSAYKSKTTGEYGKPKIEFRRVPMIYSQDDINSWRQNFLESAQRIMLAIDHDNFPCEHGSCYTYGRCSFSDICDRNLTERETRHTLEIRGFENYHVGDHWDPAKNL